MANSDKSRALEDGALLLRIADALERLAPPAIAGQLPEGDAFVWEPAQGGLIAVPHVAHVDLSLLKGVENQRDTLLTNTRRFAATCTSSVLPAVCDSGGAGDHQPDHRQLAQCNQRGGFRHP